MVRIRMQRFGRRNRPFYRIPRWKSTRVTALPENLGWYNPLETDPAKQLFINDERVKFWLGKGAQPMTPSATSRQRNLIDAAPGRPIASRDRDRVAAKLAAAKAAEAEKAATA